MSHDMPNEQEKYLTSFDGTKIYYRLTVRDPNRWLIFLHGLGGDLTAWQDERRHFTNLGISSVAVDLRGHGQSGRGENKEFYALKNFSQDILELIKLEKLAQPIIVGHCFGGMVSMVLEANHPKSSHALVLVDTSYKPPFIGERSVEQSLLQILFDALSKFSPQVKIKGRNDHGRFIGTDEFNIPRLLDDILHTSLRSYLLVCDNLVGYDARELLRKILVPSLIIEGSIDRMFPKEVAQYLQKRIKHSELDLIEGANHILVLNNPRELSHSIETYLHKIKFLEDVG